MVSFFSVSYNRKKRKEVADLKKVGKVLLILGSIIFAFFVIIAVLFLLSGGPADPIILTEEEEQKQNVEQAATYATTDLSGLSTKAITGENVTDEIFADYDLTMVNIWFTGCSPCINEMPELEALYQDLPEGCNILTICTDLVNKDGKEDKGEIKFANKVMDKIHASFLTLIPDEVLVREISEVTTIFPTTIFVDKNGKVVGEPHFGGHTSEAYRTTMLERLEQISEKESKK